jgi:hypothetical protein
MVALIKMPFHFPYELASNESPASHILATFAKNTKKGNVARSQIPFQYCDGAEGGI